MKIGLPGCPGPQGCQGERGKRGKKGDIGSKGDTGATGPAGPSTIYSCEEVFPLSFSPFNDFPTTLNASLEVGESTFRLCGRVPMANIAYEDLLNSPSTKFQIPGLIFPENFTVLQDCTFGTWTCCGRLSSEPIGAGISNSGTLTCLVEEGEIVIYVRNNFAFADEAIPTLDLLNFSICGQWTTGQ